MHPEVDAVAGKRWRNDSPCVQTGCFAMRSKYFKQMLAEYDLNTMETENICIEWETTLFLEKMQAQGLKVVIFDEIGLQANIANSFLVDW